MKAVHGLDKIPDNILLKKSREEVGGLLSEINFLEAEVKRLETDLNTKAGFKLTQEQKIEIRTSERINQLLTRNKKLEQESKKLKRDNANLIYRVVQLEK